MPLYDLITFIKTDVNEWNVHFEENLLNLEARIDYYWQYLFLLFEKFFLKYIIFLKGIGKLDFLLTETQ